MRTYEIFDYFKHITNETRQKEGKCTDYGSLRIYGWSSRPHIRELRDDVLVACGLREDPAKIVAEIDRHLASIAPLDPMDAELQKLVAERDPEGWLPLPPNPAKEPQKAGAVLV